ncbi:MAG TPA: hypothetical protein PLK94_02175, partial [Alphaproteobacteria bacterium]|nr:hypothetical protein [Alphaproteobacteria bacterium]
MNHNRIKIEFFLNEIKGEGKSSPAGMYWNDFFLFLKKHKSHNEPDPPVPLILAASGESDASKHFRLSEQLYWAADHNCLDEAIKFLKNISSEKWNKGALEDWN